MSVHHWGESPIGQWTLKIESREPQNYQSVKSAIQNPSGQLTHVGLRLYGSYRTVDSMLGQQQERQLLNRAYLPTESELQLIYEKEQVLRRASNIVKKVDYRSVLNQQPTLINESVEKDSYRSLFELFQKKFTF